MAVRLAGFLTRTGLFCRFRGFLKGRPRLKKAILDADAQLASIRHTVAKRLPVVIRPAPRDIYITLTANCNQRCIGCRYGRDFMAGQSLPLPVVQRLLEDCKDAGIFSVRLYGGEPLLHNDLPRIVSHSVNLGLRTWLTTNGLLLREKIDELYAAGLRKISIGLYGTGEDYDDYVQMRGHFPRIESGLAYARQRYGTELEIEFGWLLMRPTCSLESIRTTWRLAERYSIPVRVNLIHYSLPYFTEGPDRQLQFRPEDRGGIEEAVRELIRLKGSRPELLPQSLASLRSIPDWLLKGPAMEVPCDRYNLIWVGADGTVQLCYVTFKLGNLHEKPLAEMLFTREHRAAAKDCFALKCPRCHCSYASRIQRHAPSLRLYSQPNALP